MEEMQEGQSRGEGKFPEAFKSCNKNLVKISTLTEL